MNSRPFTIALSTVLLTNLSSVAIADPLPRIAYPTTAQSNDGTAFCYLQTADGRTFDLGRLCGIEDGDRSSSTLSNSDPNESPAALTSHGATGTSNPACFLFDAQGRPCAARSSRAF